MRDRRGVGRVGVDDLAGDARQDGLAAKVDGHGSMTAQEIRSNAKRLSAGFRAREGREGERKPNSVDGVPSPKPQGFSPFRNSPQELRTLERILPMLGVGGQTTCGRSIVLPRLDLASPDASPLSAPAPAPAPSPAAEPDYWFAARRPFAALVFVLPWLLVYEVGAICLGQELEGVGPGPTPGSGCG